MKNCEPALSRRPGTSTADTAPRVCFSAFGSKRSSFEPAGAVLRRLRRILRQRIAALDDAHRDHAVERRAVVGALAGAGDEVRHVVGRGLGQQVEHDRAEAGLDHGLLALELGGGQRARRRTGRPARGTRAGAARAAVAPPAAAALGPGGGGTDEQEHQRQEERRMGGIIGAGRRCRPAIVPAVGEALTIRAPRRGNARPTRSTTASAQSPFSLAPDPQFLYLSESHEEAIRQLLDAARRNEGVIVLTGDVGTGKTTIARALLTRLDKTSFASLVLNPFLSVDELLREILLDFGVVSRDDIRSGRAVVGLAPRPDEHAARLPAVAAPDRRARRAHHRRSAAPAAGGARTDSRDLDRRDQHHAPAPGRPDRSAGAARRARRRRRCASSTRACRCARCSSRSTRGDVEAYVAHRLSVAGNAGDVHFDSGAIDAVHAAHRRRAAR